MSNVQEALKAAIEAIELELPDNFKEDDYPVSYKAISQCKAALEALEKCEPVKTVQREGWVSVPIEPTEEMCKAGAPHCKNNNFTSMMVYEAMIQAAPKE